MHNEPKTNGVNYQPNAPHGAGPGPGEIIPSLPAANKPVEFIL